MDAFDFEVLEMFGSFKFLYCVRGEGGHNGQVGDEGASGECWQNDHQSSSRTRFVAKEERSSFLFLPINSMSAVVGLYYGLELRWVVILLSHPYFTDGLVT